MAALASWRPAGRMGWRAALAHLMKPLPTVTHTSWVLARNGQRLTCTLIADEGRYFLKLSHRGRSILAERCDGPQHAISRSFEAFTALLTHGWICDQSVN